MEMITQIRVYPRVQNDPRVKGFYESDGEFQQFHQ